MPAQVRKRKSDNMADAKPKASQQKAQKRTERETATHIFFWGGVLSNWSTTTKFAGARCFEHLIPELDRLGIEYPSLESFSSYVLKEHHFNCGEQWMMAMKGWLFERDLELGTLLVDGESNDRFDVLKSTMYEVKAPKEWTASSKEMEMWESTICKVLRTKNPRQQKGLGRRAKNFDENVWSAVNMACVTAACTARAQVDPVLKKLYLSTEGKQFVEGSPSDIIWGVGLHWNSSQIEDPSLWQGENRLGLCHDQAASKIRDMFQ